MTEQLTLLLPREFLNKARSLAGRAGLPVDAYLVDTLSRSLEPLGKLTSPDSPERWPDEKVVDAADSRMPAEQDERLSELLGNQREGELLDDERSELDALMETYYIMSMRKTEAWTEAVHRGLREPPKP